MLQQWENKLKEQQQKEQKEKELAEKKLKEEQEKAANYSVSSEGCWRGFGAFFFFLKTWC